MQDVEKDSLRESSLSTFVFPRKEPVEREGYETKGAGTDDPRPPKEVGWSPERRGHAPRTLAGQGGHQHKEMRVEGVLIQQSEKEKAKGFPFFLF